MNGETKAKTRRQSPWLWGLGALAAALVLRLALWSLYQPIPFGDTGSYRRLAGSILDGWRRYDGTRTPGYPLFLAAAGDDQRVWLAQMTLGLAITMLVFLIAWWAGGKAWFAGLAALAHTFNPGQLFFEANLLTETLATFWVVLTAAGVFLWARRAEGGRDLRYILLAAGLGVSASLAWLTRPQFLYLPFWTALVLGLSGEQRPWRGRFHWRAALACLLPALALAGLWVNFIHSRFNTWSVSVMTGYNLIQHTGHYFEDVPDEYAALRDTYLEYREARIAAYGTQTNTIWEAIPAMQAASGLNFYRLSRTLAAISLRLIWEHPDLYLRNVASGWWFFWRAPVYWTPEALRLPALAAVLGPLILAARLALVAANLVFVLTTLAGLVSRRVRAAWLLGAGWWHLAGAIWLASILQTLVDHGDNPRFLVPLQTLVVLWVLWVGAQSLPLLRPWLRSRRRPAA